MTSWSPTSTRTNPGRSSPVTPLVKGNCKSSKSPGVYIIIDAVTGFVPLEELLCRQASPIRAFARFRQ